MSKKIENGKILEIYYGDAKNIRFAEKIVSILKPMYT